MKSFPILDNEIVSNRSAMRQEVIIKKARKKKRLEEMAAPLMIMIGFFLIMFLVYIVFLYKRNVFVASNIMDLDILCGVNIKVAEKYLYDRALTIGWVVLGGVAVLQAAMVFLFKGIKYAKGNRERELLLQLFEEKK